MSVNRAAIIFSFTHWVIYVPIGCRHPFMRYWQPLDPKTTWTCSLPNPENERQQRVNSFRWWKFGNQGIVWIFARMTVLLTALAGTNTIYQSWNTDAKLIHIAKCTTCKSALLVVEIAILIRYYWQTAYTRAVYESIDGPDGRPTNNLPNSDIIGVYHRTVPKLTVQVYWPLGLLIW